MNFVLESFVFIKYYKIIVINLNFVEMDVVVVLYLDILLLKFCIVFIGGDG